MARIIIRKENNTITSEQISKGRNKEEKTNIQEPKVFEFLNIDEDKKSSVTRQMVSFIFRTIKSDIRPQSINYLYTNLLNVANEEELEKLFLISLEKMKEGQTKRFLNEIENTTNRIKKLYPKQKEEILNSFANQTITEYYKLITKNLPKEQIKSLENLILKDSNTTKIMDCLGIDFSKTNKTVYKLSRENFKTAIDKRYFGPNDHLCWNCCTKIVDCPKIMDVRKKNIEKYDFITDGEQIYDSYGRLETFIVKRCKKFKR